MDGELRVSGIVDCGADEYYGITTYTFIGDGNWDVAANWLNNIIPPSTITGTAMIIIDPIPSGECVLNIAQHISNSAQLKVNANKKFRVMGNLVVNN